jgi:hypothetical protein
MNESYFISRSYDDLRNLFLILDKKHSKNMHTIYTYTITITEMLYNCNYIVHNKDAIYYVNCLKDSAFIARNYTGGKQDELIGFWARTILYWKNLIFVKENIFIRLYKNLIGN